MADKFTVRIVIAFLGFGFLLCLVGGFVLAAQRIDVPEFLVGLGGTALGSLGTLLSRVGTEGPQDVNVVNDRRDPVPTTTEGDK